MNYDNVISSVPQPDWKERKIKQYQTTKDIIADLIYCFKMYHNQLCTSATEYYTGNIKKDSENIWSFIKDNIHYEAEPFDEQTTASITRILHEKKGDCKHSALLAASYGYCMGYNVIFRFVSYDKNKVLGHVYVILQDPETKEKIIVDPLQAFNYEKFFTNKKDYLIKNEKQMLNRLTGIHDEGIMSGKIKTLSLNIPAGESNEQEIQMIPLNEQNSKFMSGIGRHGKLRKKLSDDLHKAGKVFKKVSLAPVRAAFDLLLTVNFSDFAKRFKSAYATNPSQVEHFIKTFGWDKSKFLNNVEKGASKKAFAGLTQEEIEFYEAQEEPMPGMQGIGQIAAAATAAAAAIGAAIDTLKKIGHGHPNDARDMQEAANVMNALPNDNQSTVLPSAPIFGGTPLIPLIGLAVLGTGVAVAMSHKKK